MRNITRFLLPVVLVLPPFLVEGGAQTPPPIRGTMALEGSVKAIYKAANTLVVATVDGVEHVYHFTSNLVVHGGRKPGPDGLVDLREGTTVVVHYDAGPHGNAAREIDRVGDGDEGLFVSEGRIAHIDRRKQQLVVRLDDGTRLTYKLTSLAAAEESQGEPASADTRVVIYYTNESGERVAHYFRKVAETPRDPRSR